MKLSTLRGYATACAAAAGLLLLFVARDANRLSGVSPLALPIAALAFVGTAGVAAWHGSGRAAAAGLLAGIGVVFLHVASDLDAVEALAGALAAIFLALHAELLLLAARFSAIREIRSDVARITGSGTFQVDPDQLLDRFVLGYRLPLAIAAGVVLAALVVQAVVPATSPRLRESIDAASVVGLGFSGMLVVVLSSAVLLARRTRAKARAAETGKGGHDG